jgi:hypothetical protein
MGLELGVRHQWSLTAAVGAASFQAVHLAPFSQCQAFE